MTTREMSHMSYYWLCKNVHFKLVDSLEYAGAGPKFCCFDSLSYLFVAHHFKFLMIVFSSSMNLVEIFHYYGQEKVLRYLQ